MIRNLVLDIGGVLVNCDPREYLRSFGYEESKVIELMTAIGLDPVWVGMDLGEYETYQECAGLFVKHHPEFEKELREFFSSRWMPCVYTPLQDGIDLIGPAPESVAKVQDLYRQVLYLKGADREELNRVRRALEKYIEINSGFQSVYKQFDYNT